MHLMARRKSDAERGPLGAWAYNTRDLIGLSVAEVLKRLPTQYSEPTLRKIEGGSSKPGRRMWREMRTLYQEVAAAADIVIDYQPQLEPEPDHAPPSPDLAAALMALAVELKAMREERVEMQARVRFLEGAVANLTPQADATSPERSVPHGTAG